MFSTRYTKPSVQGKGAYQPEAVADRAKHFAFMNFHENGIFTKHKETYAKSENFHYVFSHQQKLSL
jgi:hypothetical protein